MTSLRSQRFRKRNATEDGGKRDPKQRRGNSRRGGMEVEKDIDRVAAEPTRATTRNDVEEEVAPVAVQPTLMTTRNNGKLWAVRTIINKDITDTLL